MNIGFDLDGIFIDTPPLIPKKFIEWMYREHNQTLSYRIPSEPEKLIRKLTHYHLFRPSIEKNIVFLRNTSKKNKKIYLISSRFSFLENKTFALIKKYAFNNLFDEMFFNFSDKQPHIFKSSYIKKLHIQKYVDDDLDLITYLAKNNVQTTFFWLNNKTKKKLKKNLYAITKLSEVFTNSFK